MLLQVYHVAKFKEGLDLQGREATVLKPDVSSHCNLHVVASAFGSVEVWSSMSAGRLGTAAQAAHTAQQPAVHCMRLNITGVGTSCPPQVRDYKHHDGKKHELSANLPVQASGSLGSAGVCSIAMPCACTQNRWRRPGCQLHPCLKAASNGVTTCSMQVQFQVDGPDGKVIKVLAHLVSWPPAAGVFKAQGRVNRGRMCGSTSR